MKTKEFKLYQIEEIEKLKARFIESNNLNPLEFPTHTLSCPHCDSHKYVKNGSAHGRKRYKCSNTECHKSFSIATNTAIHYLHKTDTWTDFIYLMLSSRRPLTIVELAEKLGVSTKTAHVWKHKLLSAMNETDQIHLSGQIEMDEVFLPFCVKGRRGNEKTKEVKKIENKHKINKKNSVFLCIHNRNKDFDFQPIKIQQKGQLSSEDIGRIVESLEIEKNTVVITDKSKGSCKYFKTRTDIIHEVFKSDGKKTKMLHNNNINSTMSLYKEWSVQFKGYSTKYIWNYLKWFRFHRMFLRMEKEKLEYMVKSSVKDQQGNLRFNEIPNYYEEYLKSA